MLHCSSWDRGAHQLNFQNACYSLQLQALHPENFFLCFCVLEPGVRCHVLSIPWWGMDRFKIVQRCVKYVYLLITASFQYSVVSWFFHIQYFFYFHTWKTTYAFYTQTTDRADRRTKATIRPKSWSTSQDQTWSWITRFPTQYGSNFQVHNGRWTVSSTGIGKLPSNLTMKDG